MYVALKSNYFFLSLATNGTSFNLLKLSTKRRRTKAQIQLDREEQEHQERNIARAREEAEFYKQQYAKMEADVANSKRKSEAFDHFVSKGKLIERPNGDVIAASDLLEDNYV